MTTKTKGDYVKDGIALTCMLAFLGGWVEVLVGIWVDTRWVWTGGVMIVMLILALILTMHWDENS